VPATAPTAQTGKWVAGPGAEFLHAVEAELGTLPFIAEDLGAITPDVYALRDQFRLPGMRVLQFAFDGKADNPHLPSNYNRNTIVYTGTHDNTTTRAWYEDLPEDQRINFWKSLNRAGGEPLEAALGLMNLAWSSVAAVSVAPLQDVLNLGKEARMNTPGRAEGNWDWRCTQAMLDDPAFNWLLDLTKSANRSSPVRKIRPRKTLQTASKN
jgi:4-alpha-glucanotransferase